MKYISTVTAVNNVRSSGKFYEDLLGLEIRQDYGTHISFSCGLSLQQEFAWLTNLPKNQIPKKSNHFELY